MFSKGHEISGKPSTKRQRFGQCPREVRNESEDVVGLKVFGWWEIEERMMAEKGRRQ